MWLYQFGHEWHNLSFDTIQSNNRHKIDDYSQMLAFKPNYDWQHTMILIHFFILKWESFIILTGLWMFFLRKVACHINLFNSVLFLIYMNTWTEKYFLVNTWSQFYQQLCWWKQSWKPGKLKTYIYCNWCWPQCSSS